MHTHKVSGVFVRLWLLLCFVLVLQVEAATPYFWIFSGKPLAKPVIIAPRRNDFRLIQAVAEGARTYNAEQLAARPFLEVAEFWGLDWLPDWQEYERTGRVPTRVQAKDATLYARFYPAYNGEVPLYVFIKTPDEPVIQSKRRVAAEGLEILKQNGVPIELP